MRPEMSRSPLRIRTGFAVCCPVVFLPIRVVDRASKKQRKGSTSTVIHLSLTISSCQFNFRIGNRYKTKTRPTTGHRDPTEIPIRLNVQH